jgi:hypothetical protein
VDNKPLSVIAVRVGNPDCSPARIYGWDTAQTPLGFTQIVSNDFPILYGSPHVVPKTRWVFRLPEQQTDDHHERMPLQWRLHGQLNRSQMSSPSWNLLGWAVPLWLVNPKKNRSEKR